jgi:enoyl-CoA hydratase/carnithine racemase
LSTAPEPAPPVLTTVEASVAHIVLNRPQARNAITVALATGLAEALREAAARAGTQRALGLILSGDRLTGAEAQQWGLVYRAVPAGGFEAAVAGLAANLAGKDPVALARAKRLVRDGLPLPLGDGLTLETDAIIEHLGGADAAAGISRFTGRDREEST